MSDIERVPPNDARAEAAVLGAMLRQKACIADVAAVVTPEDFYQSRHMLVFKTILALWSRGAPADTVSVADELGEASINDAGGYPYLHELWESAPTAANAEYHATIVREKSVQRQLIHAGTEMARDAYSGSASAEELLEQAERKVFSISAATYKSQTVTLGQALSEVQDLIDARVTGSAALGLKTGFIDLDDVIGGLRNGEVTILAARPSHGKTALAAHIALNVAKEGHHVMFVSLEQSSEELGERLLSLESRVDAFKLKRGFALDEHESTRIITASAQLHSLPLSIDDSPGMTFLRIASLARRAKTRGKLDLLCVDYLQLIDPDQASRRAPRQEQVSEISRRIKLLARDLKVPILMLAQVNRAVEDQADQRPKLSSLRESGSIEQDADLVMFIHRPEMYSPGTDEGVAEVLIRKHRNGPTGELKLTFLKQYTRFENHACPR